MNTVTNTPTGPESPKRWLIGGIMLLLTVWGVYIASGAFAKQRSLLQGSLVLICVFGFLGFWGLMLLSQKSEGQSRYSRSSIAGFLCGVLALLLTIPIDLSTQVSGARLTLDLSRPGVPLLVSAVLLGLSVLLSTIGLSRPRPLVGKNLGLCAVPIVIAWLLLAARIAD